MALAKAICSNGRISQKNRNEIMLVQNCEYGRICVALDWFEGGMGKNGEIKR